MSPIPSSTNGSSAAAAGSSATQSSPLTDPLANESTFLTLLVSQLKNQDPLNPTDSTQFVSQLTAYSQLEQLIGIHNNTTTLSTATTPAAAPAASATPAAAASSAKAATPAPSSTVATAMAAAAHALQSLL